MPARQPWLTVARAGRRRNSLILGYHGVDQVPAAQDPEGLCVSPDHFREHLELLADAGFEFVTVRELVSRMHNGGFPSGAVALSFDDGLANLRSVALPILREFSAPATVYVISGMLGAPYPWTAPEARLRLMEADELRDLVAAGWEIGAHTVDHPDLSLCEYEQSLRQMVESRETLERLIDVEVTTFAYPFARYNEAAARAARDAGFAAAVTYSALTTDPYGRFRLTRDLVTPRHRARAVALKAAGVYDRLFWSPPGRALRAIRRRVRGGRRDAAASAP